MATVASSDFYNVEDEGESILRNGGVGASNVAAAGQRPLVQQIYEKLDKIVTILIVCLLLFFFIHSSGAQTQKPLITADSLLVGAPESDSTSKIADPPKKKSQPSRKKHAHDSEEDSEDEKEVVKPKKGKISKDEKKNDNEEDSQVKTKKRGKDLKKVEEEDSEDLKPSKKQAGKKSHLDDEDSEEADSLEDDQKPKKSKQVAEEDDSEVKPLRRKKKVVADDEESEEEVKKGKKKEGNSLDDSEDFKAPTVKKEVKKEDKAAEKSRLHQRRSEFFKGKEKIDHLEYLKLAKFNLNSPSIDPQEQEVLLNEEEERLEKKYQLSQYEQELSICAIVHANTHKKPYSHEYILNSLLNQKYSNFIVVYVADGFTADEVEPIKSYIKEKDADNRVNFVWNPQKKYFLESTMTAINDQCLKKKVTIIIDGDDQLLGHQVFRVLNAVYRDNNANVVYGNFIEYHQNEQQMKLGFSTEYEDFEKKDNKYRSVGQKFGSLKTFRTRLATYINEADLKDQFGNYYRYAGDYALMYPLLELACGQVHYMPEYNYLYFGYEIDPTYGSLQISAGRQIREKDRYLCYKKYK